MVFAVSGSSLGTAVLEATAEADPLDKIRLITASCRNALLLKAVIDIIEKNGVGDVRELYEKVSGLGVETSFSNFKLILHRLAKRGVLVRISKGKYASGLDAGEMLVLKVASEKCLDNLNIDVSVGGGDGG